MLGCAQADGGTYGGDGVEGGVSTDAEVRAGDVVGDGGGDDHHGNTHLFVLLSGLNQLQTSHIGLQSGGDDEDELCGVGRLEQPPQLTSNPPMITRAWMLNLEMFWLISSIILPGKDLYITEKINKIPWNSARN